MESSKFCGADILGVLHNDSGAQLLNIQAFSKYSANPEIPRISIIQYVKFNLYCIIVFPRHYFFDSKFCRDCIARISVHWMDLETVDRFELTSSTLRIIWRFDLLILGLIKRKWRYIVKTKINLQFFSFFRRVTCVRMCSEKNLHTSSNGVKRDTNLILHGLL